MRKAHLSLIIGDTKTCLHLVEQFERMYPSNHELMMLKADAYVRSNETTKAIDLMEKLLQQPLAQNRLRITEQLASLYMEQNNYLDAIGHYRTALEIEPNAPLLNTSLFFCYESIDLLDEGVLYFQSRVDQNPYDAQGWAGLGACYLGKEDYHKAISAFDYALAIDDTSRLHLAGMAEAQFKAEHIKESIRYHQMILSQSGPDAAIYWAIGECYEEIEDYQVAKRYFLKAIDIEPDHSDSRLGYAIVLEHLNEPSKALIQMENAVGINPDNAEFWYIYAELLSRHGDFEKSQLCYERSLQLEPQNEEFTIGQIDALIEHEEYISALNKVQDAFEMLGDRAEVYPRGIRALFEMGQREEGLVLLEMLVERHQNIESLKEVYPEIADDPAALELIKHY